MESLDTSTKTVSMRWSAAAAAEEFRQQQNKQHTPMYQNRSPPLYDEKTIEYQMHDLLIIDDNEIFSDDEDDEVYDVYDEPITMTNQDTSHFDTVSSSVSHIQYINSIRKDRPLPKIPEIPQRISSMPVPCTEGYGYNNGTKVSAQQVFQMLSREPPKEEWVGGVYAFKTEVDVNTKESDHSNFDAIENNTPRSRPVSDVPSLSSGGGTSSFEIQATSHQDYDTLNRISLLYTDDDPSSYHRNSFDHAPLVSNNSDSDFTKDVESYQSAIFPPIETHRPKLKKVQSSNSISHPGTMTSFSLTHDKESLKTYRRMASKTNNRQVQMTFAKYLLQLVSNHTSGETRDRLQEEAEYWIGRLSKSNHPEALYIKGHWHAGKDESRKLMGSEYKKKNMNRAFKCFQQAAKFGSVEAHYELAEYWKERLEFKKAMSNYRFAASKNHILALYKLANILIRGLLNQEKNVQQGLVYLKQAADTNEPESARSAYDLGCIYANDLESIGLEDASIITAYVTDMSNKNFPKAIHYLSKADELGLPIAAYRLGLAHERGWFGFQPNKWEAYKYYAKAAEKKNEYAMLELSRLYREGIPGYLQPNALMAYKWCERATENGNEIAEFTLGIYHEQGIGVHPDYAIALEWFSRSASKGYGPAEDKLNAPTNKRKSISNFENKYKRSNKRYYDESVRIAEKTRRATAEQTCQMM